jgi:hypothetical protein
MAPFAESQRLLGAAGIHGGDYAAFRARGMVHSPFAMSLANDDDLAIVEKLHVILGEEGNALVVAELANRNNGAGLEAIEDVAGFGVG